MNVSVKSVEIIRQKLGITYKLAEKLLKKASGDMEKAELIYRLREEKLFTKMINYICYIFNLFSKAFSNLFSYRLIMNRQKNVLINLPFWVVAVSIFILFNNSLYNFIIFGSTFVLLLIAANCEIQIKKTFNNNKNRENEKNHISIDEPEQIKDNDFKVIKEKEYSEIIIE